MTLPSAERARAGASHFYLNLEAQPGTDIRVACKEAQSLAERLGVVVKFGFNGVTCMAVPGGSSEELAADYDDCVDDPVTHSVATSRRKLR